MPGLIGALKWTARLAVELAGLSLFVSMIVVWAAIGGGA